MLDDRHSPLPSPSSEWPDAWSFPPRDSAFDGLKSRHDELVRAQLVKGWREPRDESEHGAVSELTEEVLRVFLPDHAAPDVSGYGSERSKMLLHNVLVKTSPDGEIRCQALIELRDRDGDWVGLDADGSPVKLKNAICMHMIGSDGEIEHLALHYSDAALTEVLFEASESPAAVPAHVRRAIEDGLAELVRRRDGAGVEPPSWPACVLSVDWRSRQISLDAGGKAASLLFALDHTGLITIRFSEA